MHVSAVSAAEHSEHFCMHHLCTRILPVVVGSEALHAIFLEEFSALNAFLAKI